MELENCVKIKARKLWILTFSSFGQNLGNERIGPIVISNADWGRRAGLDYSFPKSVKSRNCYSFVFTIRDSNVHLFQPNFHFLSGFVGERHSKYSFCRDAT